MNSLLAYQPEPYMVATASARAGAQNLIKSLAREFAPRIRVNSVMLGARDQLHARGFAVNAHVDRQFWEGVDIVRRLARNGNLPRHVVVHLGKTDASGRDRLMDRLRRLIDAL